MRAEVFDVEECSGLVVVGEVGGDGHVAFPMMLMRSPSGMVRASGGRWAMVPASTERAIAGVISMVASAGRPRTVCTSVAVRLSR